MPPSRRLVVSSLLVGLAAPGAQAGTGAGAAGVVETAWGLGGLEGTLLTPRAARRGLGVLMIAGSGPTDRDGNGPGLATDLYRRIAEGLAAAGHAVLRYDKRGVGGSRAAARREEDLSFPVMEADARLALRSLAARAEVRGVVPLGHSEGAMIATRLACSEAVAGLVLMAAPGRPLGVVLMEQLAAAGLPPELMAQSERILAALARGEAAADVPPALASLFRPSVQPYLASVIGVDPARDLAAVGVPTLILAGGRDLQTGESDLAALEAARPNARVVRLAAANHVLKPAPADRAGNVAVYADRAAPLDPGVMPALEGFLAALS